MDHSDRFPGALEKEEKKRIFLKLERIVGLVEPLREKNEGEKFEFDNLEIILKDKDDDKLTYEIGSSSEHSIVVRKLDNVDEFFTERYKGNYKFGIVKEQDSNQTKYYLVIFRVDRREGIDFLSIGRKGGKVESDGKTYSMVTASQRDINDFFRNRTGRRNVKINNIVEYLRNVINNRNVEAYLITDEGENYIKFIDEDNEKLYGPVLYLDITEEYRDYLRSGQQPPRPEQPPRQQPPGSEQPPTPPSEGGQGEGQGGRERGEGEDQPERIRIRREEGQQEERDQQGGRDQQEEQQREEREGQDQRQDQERQETREEIEEEIEEEVGILEKIKRWFFKRWGRSYIEVIIDDYKKRIENGLPLSKDHLNELKVYAKNLMERVKDRETIQYLLKEINEVKELYAQKFNNLRKRKGGSDWPIYLSSAFLGGLIGGIAGLITYPIALWGVKTLGDKFWVSKTGNPGVATPDYMQRIVDDLRSSAQRFLGEGQQ